MFRYALVTCLTHNETVWEVDQLSQIFRWDWDVKPGTDGKTCNLLIKEAGVFVEALTPKELKAVIEEEKSWNRI